jgi:hypothetical protein
MNPNSKQFKALSKTWAEKLKKSGFKDIEQPDGHLITYETSKYNSSHHNGQSLSAWLTMKEAQQRYYQLACQFLHDHTFDNDKEKMLWEKHSDGISYREIQKLTGVNYITAGKIIRKLAKIMFEERKYDNDDDDSGIDNY